MEYLNNKNKKKSKYDKITRPYLLNRFLAGTIDLIIVIICFILLQGFCYFTLYDSLGYTDSLNEIYNMTESSHLYSKDETGSYVELNDNYNEAIIYFYSNDLRAINDNKLNEYNDKVLLNNDNPDENFYINEYMKAVDYFKSNSLYIENVNRTYLITVSTVSICLFISLLIFYLIIPLCRKEGETIGQIIFKMCLIDSNDFSKVKKYQIIIRFLVLISINFGISAFIYFIFNYSTLLPALISLFMMSFTKGNRGPHDMISKSHVILKHRADAMDTLKAINGQSI